MIFLHFLIYHNEDNDGLFSAAIFYDYLINKMNLKNIRPPLGYFYFTSLSIKSQQENYDKIRQTTILVTIPTKSAIKAAHNTNWPLIHQNIGFFLNLSTPAAAPMIVGIINSPRNKIIAPSISSLLLV